MTTEQGTGNSWRSKNRLTLEEALHVIAFGRDLGAEDYEATAMERAFSELCKAAGQSHVQLIGDDGDDGWRTKCMPWDLFDGGAPGDPTYMYPLDYDRPVEPLWSIIWDRDGHPYLEWRNIRVDRASLERWLEARSKETVPPVRERKKRGPKPYYSEEAIAMIARHIAARPKVQGVTPATEKLLDAIREMHKKKWPKSRKPSRTTVQRALDNLGWP